MTCHHCGAETPVYHCLYLNNTILHFCDDQCYVDWGGELNAVRFTEMASVDLSRVWP